MGRLIVEPNGNTPGLCDTIVHTCPNGLERVWETDKHFMPLQYPIYFPQGKEGWHPKISLHITKKRNINTNEASEYVPDRKHREFVSMKEYYYYKLMIRQHEFMCPVTSAPHMGISSILF